MDISRPCQSEKSIPFYCPDQDSIPVSQNTMIDEQASASEQDYASDRSAIGAGCCNVWIKRLNVTTSCACWVGTRTTTVPEELIQEPFCWRSDVTTIFGGFGVFLWCGLFIILFLFMHIFVFCGPWSIFNYGSVSGNSIQNFLWMYNFLSISSLD